MPSSIDFSEAATFKCEIPLKFFGYGEFFQNLLSSPSTKSAGPLKLKILDAPALIA